MTKIIFCDFDGVLNSRKWMEANQDLFDGEHLWHHKNLDKDAVARLEKIVKDTGAKVVVSSTWRFLNSLTRLQAILKEHGFTGQVIDVTPRSGGARGNEIAEWMNSHGPIEEFVIIDDNSDMVHLMHKLVQTTWEAGLQDEHVEKAIELLGLCSNVA